MYFYKTSFVCLCFAIFSQGLVEKWLKEVQTIMLDSVLVQMKGAYDTYWASKRIEWISKWCGQIIQTVSRTTWTKEVKKTQRLSTANPQYFINYIASRQVQSRI